MAQAEFRIGELAARSGVSIDTVRYYERRRLLPRAVRTGGGFRLFSPGTVQRIRFIKEAQDIGLSLDKIEQLLATAGGAGECRRVSELLRAKLVELDERIKAMLDFRRTLSGHLAACERQIKERGAAAACPVLEGITHTKVSPEDRPEEEEEMREEKLITGGAVVAAGAASLCCIGPVLFAALGLGAFGAATVFESMRPYLLAGAVLLLAIGFYSAYFRRRVVCSPGEASVTQSFNRVGRAGLWIASVAVLALAFSPYYVGHIAAALVRSQPALTTAPAAAPAADVGLETVTVRVEGMDCASCEMPIKAALERVPGVRSADVSYQRGDARVEYDIRQTNVNQIKRAIESTGYKAK